MESQHSLRTGFLTKVNSRVTNWPLWFLGGVFVFSLVIRIAYLRELASVPQPHDLDTLLYDTIARNILAGDWLGGEEVKYTSTPFFGYFLALIYALFGPSELAARFVQLLLGACTPVLVYLAGRWLFGHKSGMAASVIAAVYAPVIFYEGIVGKAGLLVFLTSLSIVALLWAERRRSVLAWFLAGMTVAILPLLRPNTFLFLPFACLWIVMASRPLGYKQGARNLGVFLIGAIIVFAPMLLRHVYAVRAGLASSLAGIHFYIGNNPHATGTYTAVPGILPRAEGHVEDAAVIAEGEAGHPLSPSEVSQYWFNKSLQFISEEPLTFLRLTGGKLALALSGAEPHAPGHSYYRAQNSSTALKLPFLTFGIIFPLGLLGLLLSLRRSRQALILHLFFLSYLATLCLFFVAGRYRLPLAPPIFLYAAFGAAWLYEAWRQDKRRSVAAVAAVFTIFFISPRFQGNAWAQEPCDPLLPGCECDFVSYLGCVEITDVVTGQPVNGVAADGVAQLSLQLHRFPDDEQSQHAQSVKVTVLTGSGPFSFTPSTSINEDGALGRINEEPMQSDITVLVETPFLYRAPLDFARPSGIDSDETQRTIQINVESTNTSFPQEFDFRLKIVRPPVVLVHGIWSDPRTWRFFGPLNPDTPDSRFQIFTVDYKDTNGDRFELNADVARKQLGKFIEDFRETEFVDEVFLTEFRVAAVQADVVTHSMGGNVIRTLVLDDDFLRDSNFRKGDIHKLVTIDTPHLGSQFAPRLSNSNLFCRLVYRLAGQPVAGAVEDLIPGSSILQTLEDTKKFGLPAHVLVGVANADQASTAEENFNNIGFGLLALICPSLLPPGGFQEVFGGPSDLIVSETSQKAADLAFSGGNPPADIVSDIIHSVDTTLFTLGPDALSKDVIGGQVDGPVPTGNPERVIDLLNQFVVGDAFEKIRP